MCAQWCIPDWFQMVCANIIIMNLNPPQKGGNKEVCHSGSSVVIKIAAVRLILSLSLFVFLFVHGHKVFSF